jgi:hypothetical protein
MLYEYQRSPEFTSLETIATSMSECVQLNITFPHAIQVLERMVDEGSRFANLEKDLGFGAVFLLCHPGSDAL